MAKRRPTAGARRQMDRNLARINRAGSARARTIAQFIVDTIKADPMTPYDDRANSDTTGGHLRDSYRVLAAGDDTGDWVIATNRRYWRFVEFGTKEHGHAQPHIRPAIELARQVFD